MNAITLTDSVTLPDDLRDIELTVRKDGVRVVLEDRHSPGYDPVVVSLSWSQICDVELLSKRFEFETVATFRVLVEMLGKVHNNRHIYEALT